MKNKNLFLSLLAIFLLGLFIWWRFIRKRLPALIFHEYGLSIRGILFLYGLIALYSFILATLLSSFESSGIMSKLKEYFYHPFVTLDRSLKRNVFPGLFYLEKAKRLHPFYHPRVLPWFATFALLFQIIPRMILLSALLYDVFFHEQFKYVYLVIPISGVLLFEKYFLYLFKEIKEFYLTLLDEIATDVTIHRIGAEFLSCLNPRDAISIETAHMVYEKVTLKPFATFSSAHTRKIRIENNIPLDRHLTAKEIELASKLPDRCLVGALRSSLYVEEYNRLPLLVFLNMLK